MIDKLPGQKTRISAPKKSKKTSGKYLVQVLKARSSGIDLIMNKILLALIPFFTHFDFKYAIKTKKEYSRDIYLTTREFTVVNLL